MRHRQFWSESHTRSLIVLVLALTFLGSMPVYSQGTPGVPQPTYNPLNVNPAGSIGTTPQSPNPYSGPAIVGPYQASPLGQGPNPYSQPTTTDTRAFLNSNPVLNSQPPDWKEVVIQSGGAGGLLSSYYLPNGQQNPFYQNGQVVANWYLRGTWSSPTMNWQGVQPNGFLPTYTTGYGTSSPFGDAYKRSWTPSPYIPNYPQRQSLYDSQGRPVPGPGQASNLTPSSNLPSPIETGLQRYDSFRARRLDTEKAIIDRQRALALREVTDDKIGQAANHAALAELLLRVGRLDEAFSHMTQAETIASASKDPRLQADLLRVQGAAYLATGDFESAIVAYQKGISNLLLVGNDNPLSAELYVSIGWAYQSLGDIPHALQSYRSARTLFQTVADQDGMVRATLGIGSLYQSMGDAKMASIEYEKFVSLASKEQRARMIVNAAEYFQSQNQPKQALSRYEKALSLLKDGGDATLEVSILVGMGRCQMALRRFDAARADFDQARAKAEQRNKLAEAAVLAATGELYYWIAISEGPYSGPSFRESLAAFTGALALMQSTHDRVGEIGVLANMGLVYDARGKGREALAHYRQALSRMEDLQNDARLEEFRLNLAGQAAALYQRAIQLEMQFHNPREAFNLSERARARSFLDGLGNARIHDSGRSVVDQEEQQLRRENISLQRQIGQELAKPLSDVNFDRVTSLQDRLSSVRGRYANWLREMKVRDPRYASFVSISPLTLAEVQQQLSPETTVLSYFVTPDATLAFVITRDRLHISKVDVSEADLSLAVATFLDFSGEAGVPLSLRRLYSWLIEPVKSRLKTRSIVVVPYGVLNGVPFAALTADGERYFGESHTISYLPSASVLPYMRARVKASYSKILVLANDLEEGSPRLTYAEDEARAVALIFGTQPVLGNEATLARLRKDAANHGVIHLIAHFEVDSEHPQSSRIVLGRSNETEASLEVADVFNLDLQSTDLVVLSGCRSQMGKWTRGDDVIALSRAFIYAGSPSVIASLWSVDDAATQQLMAAFYKHLKAGVSKVEALHAAQREVRRAYPNPFYWAGFVLTGDPGGDEDSATNRATGEVR